MPPLALALVLLSATLHASWNLLIARSRDTDVTTALAVPIGALLFLPFALPGWHLEAEAWPYLLVSMALELLYLALLAAAYGRADLSLVYPLARGLAPVIVLVFGALVLQLTTSIGEIAGVLAVAVGVLLVRGLRRGTGGADWPGTFLALATKYCRAGMPLFRLVSEQGFPAVPLTVRIPAAGMPNSDTAWDGAFPPNNFGCGSATSCGPWFLHSYGLVAVRPRRAP